MKIEIVQNPKQGIEVAKRILYKTVNSKTALFLSGGTTPKPLYKFLAEEKKLNAGAVAFVDERYGEPFHKNSNERMIKDTGLLFYFEGKKIPFYSILRLHPENYDKKVRSLLSDFPKRIAIMGIGEDGHTASLRAGTQNSKLKTQKYVIEVSDFPGEFKERITLTFKALSKMDLLIVLVFGSAKKNALNLVFTEGSVEEIPARFYTKPEIAGKTILITDQTV